MPQRAFIAPLARSEIVSTVLRESHMLITKTITKEVYVFDSGVPEIQALIDALGPDPIVIILDSGSDGMKQLAGALASVSDIDAIHIFSHGSEGALYLGDTVLSSYNMTQYTGELETIGAALSELGDILLYGCNVAKGDQGQAFIQQIAGATGADVAASIDLTGNAELGGNGVLELTSGAIESALTLNRVVLAVMDDVLAASTGYSTLLQISDNFEITGDRNIDAVLIGSKWTLLNQTYSFPTSGDFYVGYTTGQNTVFSMFNLAQQVAVKYAFDLISSYTNLSFSAITETETSHAIHRFGGTGFVSSPPSNDDVTTAQGRFPADTSYAGDVWFNDPAGPAETSELTYTTPAMGNWGLATMMHEIGHSLGLKHGHQDLTNVDLSINLTVAGPRFGTRDLLDVVDGQPYSLMTYTGYIGQQDSSSQGDKFNQPQTYMLYDIAALQYMYGANYDMNAGNTTYTFSTATGEMFVDGHKMFTAPGAISEIPTANIVFRTVWDGSGNDTYDLSNYATPLSINLEPGEWLVFDTDATNGYFQRADNGPLTNGDQWAPGNVANALLKNNDVRSLIENATGGSGNDIITGNSADNALDGGNGDDIIGGGVGNDKISGGTGDDTAVYGGPQAGYSAIFVNGNVVITDTSTANGDEGVDHLIGIEVVKFSDVTIRIDDLAPPIVVPGGKLDTSFDGDGKLTTAIGENNAVNNSLALQADGKIVVAGGSVNANGDSDFALARYNADGTLDTTFDGDGKLTTAIGAGSDVVTSLALQADGKIVVGGTSSNGANSDFVLARYNANGTLDSSFDGDGKLVMAFGTGSDQITSLVVQADGKIVVGGQSENGVNGFDFALARYNTNGTLDNTFSGDGKLTTHIGSSNFQITGHDYLNSLAVQADGRIVAGGQSINDTGFRDFALARYNINGTLDNTFSGDGKLTTAIGMNNEAINSIALQADGKIVVAGWSRAQFLGTVPTIARYNPNGMLDATFDADGIFTSTIVGTIYSLAVQADGRIVAAGQGL